MELFGHQSRFGQMAAPDMILDRGEQSAVERLVEMGRCQSVANPLKDAIIIEQNAQQGLFGLKICRGVDNVKDRSRRT
jgi:hypothetical protein